MTFLIFSFESEWLPQYHIIFKKCKKIKITVISRVKTEYPIDGKQML